MKIRGSAITILFALSTLVSAPATLASPATVALHNCSAGRLKLTLNITEADSAPSLGSLTESAASTVKLQLGEAAGVAKGVCKGSAHAFVRNTTARIASLYRHGHRAQARRLLGQLLARLRASGRGSRLHRTAHGASRSSLAHAASGCSFEGTAQVSLRDVDGVADDLAAAAAAQLIGDERTADEAIDTAREAFAEWVKEGAGGAQSAGDWMSVAAAAQWLGNTQIADEAMARARAVAREALNTAEQLGACSASTDDAPCVMRALTVAILLGAHNPGDVETVKQLLETIAETGKGASDCEEWSLSVSITGSSSQGMSWGPAAFIVNRKAGTIQDAAGVGDGWPGEIASETGPCYENGTQVGVGTLSGSSFHFNISGKVVETGLLLELKSTDNHVGITASGPPACQALAALGETFVNAFLQGPFPVYLALSPGQMSVDSQETSGETTFHEVADRVR